MLQQILRDLYVDPEILAELDEQQKQTLFCKMREEQVRRWTVWNEKLGDDPPKNSNKKNNKCVSFLKGEDGEPWVWVMGEHKDDKSIEDILKEEAIEKARKMAEKEAEQLRKQMEAQLSEYIDLTPKIEDLAPSKLDYEDDMDIYCSVDELREKINHQKPSLTNYQFNSYHQHKNNKMNLEAREVLQEISLNTQKVAQRVALWEKRLTEERTTEIFKNIRRKQELAAREAEEEEKKKEQLWREQERKAKEAEQQIREIARRARAEHRLTSNMEIDTSYSTVNVGVPPNRQAVLDWYRQQEKPRLAGVDEANNVEPWFHGLITRSQAEKILLDQPYGTFLVRLSEKVWGYAISYRAQEKCKHYLVGASQKYSFCGSQQMEHNTLANFDDGADNEFAEFEDFDENDSNSPEEQDSRSKEFASSSKETPLEDSYASVEEDEAEVDIEVDSDFEHFQDADEFEGFEEKEEKPLTEPKITIAKVPLNLRQNWDSYYLEILMIFGLLVYFTNFILGKNKNSKIATSWFQTHRQLLEDNFAMVGDDGNQERSENVTLIKESENVFTLWCSGRICCEGMLVELRLIKRQDLVAIISNMMKPSLDQVQITVRMNKEDMDSFVFAVASKKTALHFSKDLQDISIYCPERKAGGKFNIPANFQVMSEIAEATSAMLDNKIITVLDKYSDNIDFIHFSDQYSGLKPSEDTSSNIKLPDVEKVLRFGFNVPLKGVALDEAMAKLKPLMSMVFYCMDKVKRYRLSKEGKNKADKNRQKVEEAFLKSTHQARAEAAAARREEKKRQEKERILAEEDPEKQRRWEIKEEKRQAKKRAPRMKQLKVKAL